MSIYSVNKAAKYRAQTYEARAAQEQNTVQLMEFGKDLLQNIRQERIAQSQLAFSNYIEGVDTSSAKGAIANIQSGLAAEEGYAYRYSQHLEDYQNYQQKAKDNWEQYAKSVKRAKTNATITVAAVGALTGGLAGAAFGAAAGAATATVASTMAAGAVSAIGDNSIAGNAAWSQALKSSASAWTSAAISSLMTPSATATDLAQGVHVGDTASGLPIYDVTGTAGQGANIAVSNSAYGMVDSGLSTFNGIPLSSMSWGSTAVKTVNDIIEANRIKRAMGVQ